MLTAELEMSFLSFQKSSHLAKTPHTNPSHCFFYGGIHPPTHSRTCTHMFKSTQTIVEVLMFLISREAPPWQISVWLPVC